MSNVSTFSAHNAMMREQFLAVVLPHIGEVPTKPFIKALVHTVANGTMVIPTEEWGGKHGFLTLVAKER